MPRSELEELMNMPDAPLKEEPADSGDEGPGLSAKVSQSPAKTYSNNVHSKRSRERRNNLQGYNKLLDKAKNADRAAILYAQKKVQKSADYQAASTSRQGRMMKEVERATVKKRKNEGPTINTGEGWEC